MRMANIVPSIAISPNVPHHTRLLAPKPVCGRRETSITGRSAYLDSRDIFFCLHDVLVDLVYAPRPEPSGKSDRHWDEPPNKPPRTEDRIDKQKSCRQRRQERPDARFRH